MEWSSQDIISFLINPPFDGWLGVLRIIFIVISPVLMGAAIFFGVKSQWFKLSYFEDATEWLTFRPKGIRKITKQWGKIRARLDTGLESEYKLAVIEGDSMLDDILRRMDYKGDNLGERLEKLTSATLPNIDDVREAHKIRTDIVHNPDYGLSLDEAGRITDIYEKALSDLQAF